MGDDGGGFPTTRTQVPDDLLDLSIVLVTDFAKVVDEIEAPGDVILSRLVNRLWTPAKPGYASVNMHPSMNARIGKSRYANSIQELSSTNPSGFSRMRRMTSVPAPSMMVAETSR